MHTPKASGTPPKISTVSVSLEKSSPSKKHSPRRQVKTSPRYTEPTASSLSLAAAKPSKDSTTNLRKTSVPEEKRGSRVAELESQICKLENDLKNVKDQLCSSEMTKKEAKRDADELRQHLMDLSLKLEDSEKQVSDLSESQKVALSETRDLQLKLAVAETELHETHLVIEEMKKQMSDCEKSEGEARQAVSETLVQLDSAKKTVETLRFEECKATETRIALALELEQSRARVSVLEARVDEKSNEVERLRGALQVSEERREEAEEQMKVAADQQEAELRKSSYKIEELKADLMDKEAELQGSLIVQLEKTISIQKDYESVRARLHENETTCKSVYDENEALKLKIKEMQETMVSDLEAAEREEKECAMKEEVEKSGRKAARVAEQLEATQAANAEMEAELRKLKVQCDQWRKAAEVAASMISVGNERGGSVKGFYDEFDEDLVKKKNANMLRRIGVLWKKTQK